MYVEWIVGLHMANPYLKFGCFRLPLFLCSYPMLLPYFPTLCSYPMFLPYVPTLCSCPMFLPYVPALCSCPMFLPYVPALCSCPMFLPYVPNLRSDWIRSLQIQSTPPSTGRIRITSFPRR
jgi:hypothetical protein